MEIVSHSAWCAVTLVLRRKKEQGVYYEVVSICGNCWCNSYCRGNSCSGLRKKTEGAVTGAVNGAAIGAIIPGVGANTGAAIGAVNGGVKVKKPKKPKKAK